jgi:transposase-like protein
MIRNSVKYASGKDLKEVVADLKKIYTVNTEEVVYLGLKSFAAKYR